MSLDIDQKIRIFADFVNNGHMDEATDYYLNEIIRNNQSHTFHQNFKRVTAKINRELRKPCIYMLTFTLDPKKVDVKDMYEIQHIEQYITKFISTTKQLELTSFDIVREGSDMENVHTHWHVCITNKGYIDKKIFNTYIRKYGHIDVSLNKTNNYDSVITYMSKTNKVISVIR